MITFVHPLAICFVIIRRIRVIFFPSQPRFNFTSVNLITSVSTTNNRLSYSNAACRIHPIKTRSVSHQFPPYNKSSDSIQKSFAAVIVPTILYYKPFYTLQSMPFVHQCQPHTSLWSVHFYQVIQTDLVEKTGGQNLSKESHTRTTRRL